MVVFVCIPISALSLVSLRFEMTPYLIKVEDRRESGLRHTEYDSFVKDFAECEEEHRDVVCKM